MARYIDADELKKRLRRSLVAENVYEMGINVGLWRATKEIDSLPTTHVEPITDTVKKMQELIKERCIEGGIYPAFVANTIDQIAKEILKGGDTE